jgi:hypothetical protein
MKDAKKDSQGKKDCMFQVCRNSLYFHTDKVVDIKESSMTTSLCNRIDDEIFA